MAEFAKRRKAFMQQINPTGIVILPAAKEVYRNGDTVYPFRQQSDFYYLTGFDEPDAILVLIPDANELQYILFNRPRHPQQEQWDGPRAGQEGARAVFLATQSYPIEAFETRLPDLLMGKEIIYYPFAKSHQLDGMVTRALNHIRAKVRGGVKVPCQLIDVLPLVHELRLHKSESEIELIQQAVNITGFAHQHAMAICKPDMYEYELEAAIASEFICHGARSPAYPSIIGSGANSCVLHYVANDQKMLSGDLVLIDAGAEYKYYAADITRTFPVNGRFTGEQRAIYDLVLASQLAAIDTIKPGESWLAAQDAIVSVLTQGLIDLAILKGSLQENLEKQTYTDFYMHRSGHWLGLDVHDAGLYRIDGRWRVLEPNMMLTVEPGLYLSAHTRGLAKRWHNIGVRIEDDVLVTTSGSRVLSEAIPKEIADIEAMMQG